MDDQDGGTAKVTVAIATALDPGQHGVEIIIKEEKKKNRCQNPSGPCLDCKKFQTDK